MLPREIIKKINYLEIKTKYLVNNIFGGEYHSVFKGRGMMFSEVREYYNGDDIRNIHWNVTARAGKPYIKKYNEEIGMKGSGIILFDGTNFLINNIKECVKELYQIFKDENCNIKPKIQRI